MFLSLNRVHVEHVHAVLHAVVDVVGGWVGGHGGEASCPSHHPLAELGKELRVEVHPAGSLGCRGEGELIRHRHGGHGRGGGKHRSSLS